MAVALAICALAALAGVAVLEAHASQPGPLATPPPRWPGTSQLQPAADKPTLLLFAHPRCPCTRATLAELDGLVRRSPALDVRVLFFRPRDQPDEWVRGDSFESASAIPGARVSIDVSGAEARRFGALTSGQAVLYQGGALRFQGGLTVARGHQGQSAGSDAVEHWLRGQPAAAEAPVFGCALLDLPELEAR
jgi:hypothetical protein